MPRYERSDQFDIRINVGEECEHLKGIEERLANYYSMGSVRYYHVSGVERGDNQEYDSFGKLHVHIALVLFNFTSKQSVINKLGMNRWKEGYYVACRNKALPLSGWKNYHMKAKTKVGNVGPLRVEKGIFPVDRVRQHETASTKLKREAKIAENARKRYLITTDDMDQLELEFPSFEFSSVGRAMIHTLKKQRRTKDVSNIVGDLDNHIIWGGSGTGKSASIAHLYPDCYKKMKGTQFWDGYDHKNHDHGVVWIDEMSKETLACITGKAQGGFEFLKELADRYPVTVDQKFQKGMLIRPRTILITMNEHPSSLLPDRAVEVNKQALVRKFRIWHVDEWLASKKLKCVPGVGVEKIMESETEADTLFFSSSEEELSPSCVLID